MRFDSGAAKMAVGHGGNRYYSKMTYLKYIKAAFYIEILSRLILTTVNPGAVFVNHDDEAIMLSRKYRLYRNDGRAKYCRYII